MRFSSLLAATALPPLLLSCSSGSSSPSAPSAPAILGEPPAYFSEVVPINLGHKDAYDEDPGYIELHNPSDSLIQLKGYSLLSQLNASPAYTFGDVALPPQGRLVLFLSGREEKERLPARDSMDLMGTGAWTWADSQNKPAGLSSAGPWAFPGLLGEMDGKRAFSASITLADNSATKLDWSSASAFLGIGTATEDDAHDLGQRDQILLRGYIDAGAQLEIRLAQPDVEDWLGWGTTVTGTGEPEGLYVIDLPTGMAFPDLSRIYGLRFANGENQYRTVNFTFTSILARKRGSDLHVPLKLSKAGGSLYLIDSAGSLRDSLAYPAIPAGLSFARDGFAEPWSLRSPPTPGEANAAISYTRQLSAPVLLPASGFYPSPLQLVLPTALDSGAVLRCDTTGNAPSASSPLTGGPLTLTRTTVLRCATFADQALSSPVTLRTYLLNESGLSLPVISIATDPSLLFDPDSGLYMPGPHPGSETPYWGANYWKDVELPVQIDFFESDNRLAWSSGAGLSIFGNWSRSQEKKSVAIAFREAYGNNRLDYALFPDYPEVKSFKWFVLRNNGGNFGRDYIRDALASSLVSGLGLDFQKYRPVIVFYNGRYFGIHDLREKSNEYYFESNYGLDPASIDLVKATGDATSGSDAGYQEIMSYIATHPLDDSAAYSFVAARLDLDNFTNYAQTEIYIANKDWPGNNLKRWHSPSTPWRWFLYDTDFGFAGMDDSPEVGMLEFATAADGPDWPNPPQSTFLLRSLLKNSSYRAAFVNRLSALLATRFSASTVQARIDAMMRVLESAIPRDQERWNLNASKMQSELQDIQNFAASRPALLQSEMESFFALEGRHQLSLSVSGNGYIKVDGLPLNSESLVMPIYANAPLTLVAEPRAGSTFVGWEDGSTAVRRTWVPAGDLEVRARFR